MNSSPNHASGNRQAGNCRLLIINPGSTSTKLALYEGGAKLLQENIEHRPEELRKYDTLADQVPFRLGLIRDFLSRNGICPTSLDAVVGRGGLAFGIHTGGYRVGEQLAEALLDDRYSEPHASNLGGVLEKMIADEAGIPAYIDDAVTSSELPPEARITGFKDIIRVSQAHVLNSRAMAIRCAKVLGGEYEKMNFLVAHLGGGISASAHQRGRIIDTIGDSDGPFSPERAGSVTGQDLVKLCYSGKYTEAQMKKLLRGQGGMYAHLGTSDCREIEARIKNGDSYAALILKAQALQIAKCVGELCVVLKGDCDAIILTGGIAYSKMLIEMVIEYVAFLAPVFVYPGENEMEALAMGGMRLLSGEEAARDYSFPETDLELSPEEQLRIGLESIRKEESASTPPQHE